MQELDGTRNEFISATPLAAAGATRRSGGGRKPATQKDPTLVPDLLSLVDPSTRGDPESPLRWTCKSLRVLAEELKAMGHAISHVVVGELLKVQGFSLQGNAKVVEGNQSPDRNGASATPEPPSRPSLPMAGSNGYRVRLWKLELSRLAHETGLRIRVCHFPPGTRKWNQIEHRLFSFITMDWRGRPLITHEVIVQLIANTKTRSGLTVRSELDANTYPKGLVVSNADFSTIDIEPSEFRGEWNYSIRPA